ncbi:MAG: glycosyltransferase family 61 protein [Solirubrobacteraceae bacterium]
MSLYTRAVRRLTTVATGRGLIAGDSGPVGEVASLRAWVIEHEGHCGAAWSSVPAPQSAPLPPPRSVAGGTGPAFEDALTRLGALREMPPPALEVAKLPGARIVTPDGLVVTHDDLLATESAWSGNREASGVLRKRGLPRAQTAPGVQATLISQWCGAYYHWLTDALPRIAVLEAARSADCAVIVPEDLKPWQRRSLDLLGVGDRLTPFSGYLRADILLWPRPTAPLAGHTPSWACEWLRERFASVSSSGRRRLYLSRSGERRRRVANEDEVWTLVLEPLGFERIDAGTLSFDEQVSAFAGAGVIVAPHGGALTNIVFARQATVVELFAPDYVNLCYYVLAGRCGHAYWSLMGRAGRNGSITVDLARLTETLAAAGVATNGS